MSDEKLKEKIIIEAARNRFAHFGFSKVTMDEIAGDVELGKASLYYYFPTKEDLFRSVMEREQTEFVDEINILVAKEIGAEEKLKKYVVKRLEFFQELVNLGTLSVHSFFESKAMFQKIFKDFEDKEVELIKKIFDEGKRTGSFRSDLDENTVRVFLHILHGLRLRVIKSLKGNRMPDESLQELKQEMMISVELILKGIENKKE